MRQQRLPKAALAALALLIAIPAAAAVQEKTVEVDGVAAILVDPVTARDRAFVDARRKAVEEVAGVQVDSRAVYSMGLSQDDWVRVQAFGIVKSSEVLSEKQGSDRYTVRLRCRVISGGASSPELVREFLSRRSFIVLGKGEGAPLVVGRLKEALLGKGFQVYDEEFVRGSYADLGLPPPPQLSAGQGVPVSVAGRFLADYVVRVDASASALSSYMGIETYQGTARLQLTEVSSGFLKSHSEMSSRVFGLSKAQALEGERPDQFRRAVAAPAVEAFLKELDRVKVGGAQAIKVTLQTPSSQDALDRLVNTLKEVRWVQEVREPSFTQDAAVVTVEYPEKVVYLAADLDYLPGYAVLTYGSGQVILKEETRP